MKNTIYTFVLSLVIGFSSSVFAADRYFATQSAALAAFQVYSSCWYQKEGWYQACNVASKPDKYYWAEECPSGTVADASGECTNPCKAGDSGTGTQYVGILTGPGQANDVGYPDVVCDGQCEVVAQNVETCGTAADKPYPKPAWCFYSGVKNGKTCSYSPATDPAPNDDSGVCPGGNCPVPTCNNGASDYPTCTPPTCSNGATDYPACTPPKCANGATNYPECTAGTCANGANDWPACTPVGTCPNGATNYPACTSGGSGSGTGTCLNGATDYPRCTTPIRSDHSSATLNQIDESGTPTGVGADGEAGLDKAASDRMTGFDDNTKVAEIPWSFQFSLPATACSPISWSVFSRVQSIDLCPVLERVRAALAYLWYGLACIYCWKRVTGATGATA